MINKICLVLALCLITLSMRVNHQQRHNMLPGGWTPIDVHKLTKEQKSMDEFIRKSIKEYENATLVEGETQVVAGTNYRYVYKVIDQQGRKTLDEVTGYEDLNGNKVLESGH